MAQDQELNKILKQMWLLDEKITDGEILNISEKDFYNTHLENIQKYYTDNGEYWNRKTAL